MPHNHVHGRMYRMPYGFGPAAGPRQGPTLEPIDWSTGANRWTASVSFLTDAAMLDNLLPPGFELVDEPVLTVEFSVWTAVPWLAGRGYSMLGVRFPARFNQTKPVRGSFLSVLWENMADPVVTGREELGCAKLWCELQPPRIRHDRVDCSASWLGHKFFDLSIRNLSDPSLEMPSIPGVDANASEGTLHYKYVPDTGNWGRSSEEYACLTPRAVGAQTNITSVRIGIGDAQFLRTEWEDMPTQFHVVSALANLPKHESRGAWCMETEGAMDLAMQRRLS